ncbi:MAG: hypothetical protein GXO54_04120 [Chloroflexi bacterium]|nr:hypothetical protein [Chloroflexota bacterium]
MRTRTFPRRYAAAAAVGVVLGISAAANMGWLQPWLRWLHAVGGDKVGHGALFGLMAAVVVWAWPRAKWTHVALALSAFAGMDEAVQYLMPRRAFSFADWFASLGGIWLAAWLVARKRAR